LEDADRGPVRPDVRERGALGISRISILATYASAHTEIPARRSQAPENLRSRIVVVFLARFFENYKMFFFGKTVINTGFPAK
jgi:hypothetical protein